MKKTNVRILSVVLCLLLVLAGMPAPASALGAWDVTCYSYDGTTEYTLDTEAIDEFMLQYECVYPSLEDLAGVHPRLLVRAEDLPALRTKVQDPLLASEYNSLLTHSNLVTTGDLGPSEAANHYNTNVINCVKAKAMLYLLGEDEAVGRSAIDMASDYLDTARFAARNSRPAGDAMFMSALVYDWCYSLLTEAEKTDFIWHLEKLAMVQEIGYPPANGGNFETHATESMLFRDLLSAGVAIYDEQPRMYDLSARRLFKEMIPAFNRVYESGAVLMGTDYGIYRHSYELTAAKIFDVLGKGPVFSEKQSEVPYYFLYMRRPDGQMMRDGDNYGQDYNINKYWASPESAIAYLISASLYKDPYINYHAFLELNPDVGRMGGYNPVETLLFADPGVGQTSVSELPLTRYFPEPYGGMIARTGWTNGGKTDSTVIANMKIDSRALGGHDHFDAGSFNIYYKGALAIDSGLYNGVDSNGNPLGWGSDHYFNYYMRSIAHNSLLIYDPAEEFIGYGLKKYSNDGGQRFITTPPETTLGEATPTTLDEWLGQGAYAGDDRWRTGEVLAHQFGPDTITPAFSYIKGDITPAYSSHKVDNVQRSFVFLNGIDIDHPAAMVVFDKIISTNQDFKKTWLLHSMQEPQISGNTVSVSYTDKEYSGKLVNTTLLPQMSTIEKIGGAGNEFVVGDVNYVNYKPDPSTVADESGKWRVEVSPQNPATEDYFLNVLQPMDTGLQEIQPESVTGNKVVGAKINNSVVLFSNNGNLVDGEITFDTSNDEDLMEFIIADLPQGSWVINGSGNATQQVRNVSAEGAVLYFTGYEGSYTLSLSPVSLTETELEPMPEILPITSAPTVNGVQEGDIEITGTGEEGAAITVSREGTVIATGVADGLGNFKTVLNDGISLVEGDILTVIATAAGKDPSAEVEVTVAMSPTDHAVGVNLALNKTVTVSDYQSAFGGERAVDDSLSTEWKSNPGEDPDWIYIDLEQANSINQVILRWAETDTYAKTYKIQVSNDALDWNDVYSTEAGDGFRDIVVFDPVDARYVRIYCEESGTAGQGYTLYNIGIYSDLLGYWNFNDEASVGKDYSGNENNGTLNGTAAWIDAQGCNGSGALALDGENGSYMGLPFILDPSTSNFTASAWARLDETIGANQTILGQYGNASLWLYKRTSGGGNLAAFMTGGAFQSKSVLEDDNWYHTALSWDGTELKIYMNGICENTLTSTAQSPVTIKDSTGSMVVGRHITPNTSQEEWKGLIDEVRIYNRALSEVEIQQLYTAYQPATSPVPAPEAFIEADGKVCIEAEKAAEEVEYAYTVDRGGYSWDLITNEEGISGNYMRALPNELWPNADTSLLNTNNAEMAYKVYFTTPGIYNVHLLCRGDDGNQDSVFFGLDGKWAFTSFFDASMANQWHWRNSLYKITIDSAGYHNLNLWVKERGAKIDKIYLTTGTDVPSGAGPAESAVESPNNGSETPTVNKDALAAAITAEIGENHEAPAYVLNASDYTTESWAAYTAAINAAIAVEGNTEATQAEVDEAVAAITTAKGELELAGTTTAATLTGPDTTSGQITLVYGLQGAVDVTAQDVTISYDKDRFDFISAEPVSSGITFAQPLVNNAETGTVRFILAGMGPANVINGNTSILNIVFSPKSGGAGIIAVTNAELANSNGDVISAVITGAEKNILVSDKALLILAIQTAQEILDGAEEGIEIGQYPVGTKGRLDNAISAATAVKDNGNATSGDIMEAIEDLNAAVAKFQSLVITAATGDVDKKDGVKLGDLGIIAYYYGKVEGSEGWNKIKHADINGDGEIGLYDLAFIAKKILLN